VEVKGKTADRIDGGAIRDRNLFHSFSEFNVGESQSVYFANPENIDQIFTRVTGGDPSDILGTLGVDGAADLLLLNPNGIIFGENSSLDVEGSFFGTTADSVVFKDNTEFSTVNPQSPLLTVGVPLGLQVGTNPGSILVRSPLIVVPNGQNFSLLGGDLDLKSSNPEGAEILAPGGKVELGGLSTSGTVRLEKNGNLSFPQAIARADISLDSLTVDVTAGGGGEIRVNAKNLELFNSSLDAGIDPFVELTSGQAGKIAIDASDKVSLGSSNNNSSQINTLTGDTSEFSKGIKAQIVNTQGNAANIEIKTGSLEAQGSFTIGSITNGSGNAGSVKITATKSVNLSAAVSNEGIVSQVALLGTGNGGNIELNTPVLTLSRGYLSTSTYGAGDAGNITLNVTDAISLSQGSQISAGTLNSGDAGDILIAAPTADITFDGQGTALSTFVSPSRKLDGPSLFSGFFVGKGKGGDLTIQGRNLSVTNNAFLSTRTGGEVTAEGLANAGNLKLDITDSITLSKSLVTSRTDGAGNAGDLTINTDNLTIEDAGIQGETSSSGDGGSVNITANDLLLIGNSEEDLNTGISVSTIGSGDGGTINIDTNNLVIQDNVKVVNAGIFVDSKGDGNAGKIFAQVRDSLEMNGGGISSFSDRSSGGEIAISADNIRLTGNSNILTNVNSGSAGGNLTLSADSIVAFDDSDIFADSLDGVGGNITLDTDAFFSNNFNPAFLNADPRFLEGNNRVDISSSGAVDGSVELPNVNFLPNSLIKLSDEAIDTEQVVSNSCVVPSRQQGGTFIVYGSGALVVSPNDAAVSVYGTGDVRNLPQQAVFPQENWQPGKPIVEPEGMYRLSNGQLVLSRQCN
jgi:filamentous hemagglutinin family protein